MLPEISIIVPLFNETASFAHLEQRLSALLEKSTMPIEVILIDDGSSDTTPQLMKVLSLKDPRYQSIFLSRNFGHQFALSAGFKYARATKAIMVIDGDLQDPPELLTDLYQKFTEGYDVVYAIRKKRKEHFLKRMAYSIFYKIQKKLAFINIPLDSGDFSLIGRNVVDIINKMPEESRFIRGMRTWVGFKQIGIEYERDARIAGTTKYSIGKLFKLAYDGIFNFSEIPITFITRLGFLSMSVSFVYLFITLYKKIFYNTVPEGFTALIFAIILFSGVQLISLGIIGEYVLRIFFQVKERPLFVVKEIIIEKEVKNG